MVSMRRNKTALATEEIFLKNVYFPFQDVMSKMWITRVMI
jgi:hypothetical protein